MTDTVTIRRELLENWLIAFQCGPTTQHKAMEEMEQAHDKQSRGATDGN